MSRATSLNAKRKPYAESNVAFTESQEMHHSHGKDLAISTTRDPEEHQKFKVHSRKVSISLTDNSGEPGDSFARCSKEGGKISGISL